MRSLHIGIIQQANTADLQRNIVRLSEGIERCAQAGARLIVLPELHNTLYFCQTEDPDLFALAEPIPGPSTQFYSELAARYSVSS